MIRLEKIYSIFVIVFFSLCFFSDVFGSCMRASVSDVPNTPFWVAINFNVEHGAHITAPVGRGKSTAPSFTWKNAKVLKTVWPKHTDLPPDGTFQGYEKDFSVLFLISQINKNADVVCDVFYVICDNACRPMRSRLTLCYDGKLPQDEIPLKDRTGGFTKFIVILGMAFIGGLILNCMPCVFPVLSMKIFKILKDHTGTHKKIQGTAFGVGVIVTFLLIGLFLFYMKQIGNAVGWGFYMQNTAFVTVLLFAFLFCALYFFGILHLPNLGFAIKKTHSLFVQSFLNGIFTSIASGVCVGPFVGIAIGSALMYDNIFMAMSVFTALGCGVAFPFVCICFIPQFGKIFPKPGQWMENLKEFMGFAMLFSCLWVFWVLSAQVSVLHLIILMGSLVSIAMFVWIFHRFAGYKTWQSLAIIGVFCTIMLVFQNFKQKTDFINWHNFSLEQVKELKNSGRPVFINVTASWCMNCGLNALVFNDERVAEAFRNHNVQAVKADWTQQNDDITKFLAAHGLNSIPFNVLYKPGCDEPIIFPTLLSADEIIEELNK